jgi:hypothetical protein
MAERRDITIDTAGLQDIALKGVRRTIAFLGLGLKAVANGPPTSVALESNFQFHWFPEPLPDAAAKEIAIEYEAWLIGAGLKELDLFFGLFLDEVWDWLRLAECHGQQATIAVPDTAFRAKTRVSTKLEAVEARLGISSPWSSYFDGYSLARNALSHNAGVIRTRDTNEDGKLRLHWRGPDVVIQAPDKEVVMNQRGAPLPQVFEQGAQVLFRMTEREAEFAVGAPIRLSKFDLSEICFSYQVASQLVIKGFVEHLVAKGIPNVSAPVNEIPDDQSGGR